MHYPKTFVITSDKMVVTSAVKEALGETKKDVENDGQNRTKVRQIR